MNICGVKETMPFLKIVKYGSEVVNKQNQVVFKMLNLGHYSVHDL